MLVIDVFGHSCLGPSGRLEDSIPRELIIIGCGSENFEAQHQLRICPIRICTALYASGIL